MPPERGVFYGWWIVSAAFVVHFVTMGTTFYSFGILLVPLTEEFSASRFAVGSVLPTLMLMGAIAGPLIGREVDRRGARSLMLVGTLSMAAGFLVLSRVESVAGLYAAFGGLVAFGAALLGPITNTALVANWFERVRGTALGISQVGVSLSGLVMAYVTTWLVVTYGWRSAVLCFAAAPIAILVPVIVLVIVNRPADRGQRPLGAADDDATRPAIAQRPGGTLREALREPDLRRIALVMGMNFAGGGAVMQAIHSHATDLGYSETQAATLLSLMAGMAALGKPLAGSLADRTSPRLAMGVATVLQGIGLATILASPGYLGLLAAAPVFGLGFGGLLTLFGLLMAERFGPAQVGRMMGAAGPIMIPFQLVGLPFAAAVFDRTGSYAPAFATFLVLYAGALAVLSRISKESARAAAEPALEAPRSSP